MNHTVSAGRSMSRRRFLSAAAATTGAGAMAPLLGACSGDDSSGEVATNPDEILEAAKKEGGVSLYSSASTGPSNALAETFDKEYGIQVEVYRAGSSDVATRVEQEESARRTQADVLIIEEPALSLLRQYLAEYDSPDREDIADEFKAPETTLIRMYVAQLAWNTERVSGPEAPKDWEELMDTKWSGRIGSLDPHVTSVTLGWQELMKELYGDEFLPAFGANKPTLYASTNAMSQAIASGEIDLGITNSFGVIQLAQTGAPIEGVIPPSTLLMGGYLAVFAKAPHPNAARLLVDYACSAPGQTVVNVAGATIPTHPGASSPEAGSIEALQKDHELTQPDYADLVDQTPALLEEWDEHVK